MRVIRNAYVEDWERHPQDIQPFPAQLLATIRAGAFGAVSPEAGPDLDPDRSCMPCGQGAGGILEILSCRQIIEKVMSEARERIEEMGGLL
jgi:enoyl-[acyl-carrier protein] reductase II